MRPIVSSMKAPTTGISKMLDRFIRPLFDEHVQQTTFIDGVQFIRRLELYVSLGLLKPTTHLCTSDVTDLYTMIPQEEAIAILRTISRPFWVYSGKRYDPGCDRKSGTHRINGECLYL